MKRTSILAMFLAAVILLSTSCGTSDKVASISLTASGTTGTVNLAGLGGTLQLQVVANYTSGKEVNETNWSTYTVTPQGFYWSYDANGDPTTENTLPTPPYGISVNATGMVTATQITAAGGGMCTWVNVGTTSTPAWAYTGNYEVIATYKGMQSQPVYIPVASAANGQAGSDGQCGPSSSD